MLRVLLPAVATGVLLWAAFFPLDLGPLGFVALVPWLALVRADVSRRRRYVAAYLGGVVFFALATQWVRVAHPMMYMSWAALSVIMPVTWVLALDFVRRFDRLGVPLALSVPLGWVGLEYVRMHFPTGFPFLADLGLQHMIGFGWYFLGYTQHAFVPLIQVADVGGVYAVSFVVAAVNGAVAGWVYRSRPSPLAGEGGRESSSGRVRGEAVPSLSAHPSPGGEAPPPSPARGEGKRPIRSTAAVLLLVATSVGYGYWRLDHPEFAAGPRVAALQGSVPQDAKDGGGSTLVEAYRKLFFDALAEQPKPDLIVWPETCFADEWIEVAPGEQADPEFAAAAKKCAERLAKGPPAVPTLLGLNGLAWEGGRRWKYNSALLLDTRGHKLGRYDKMHLVPFGEYVPLGETLPFMSVFTPYKHDYSCRPGQQWTRFPLPAGGRKYTFGCLICYEDSDPSLARRYVAADPVDFLVNISNDGWFDGTEEHEQHLAICRFRAVEARRAVVRAVNMGISGVIDPDGRVVALPGPTWAASKKVEAVVTAVVPLDSRTTWYARTGDWVPAACWLAVAASFALAWRRRRG
ncbi:apolipoprotein N-acyltransferase [Gemmata sp.]|uniref:apolipoprotein N-acyltransferase n=1 Tax=Gemmata sp. TaxID=1914242 RepID=UPI003F6EF3EF